MAPALPVCFCRCPQSWAEPRRPSPRSAPLLWPSLLRMGHSPLSPILGGHLLNQTWAPASGCPPPAVGLGATQNELCASSFPALQGPHCRWEAGEPTHVSLTALGALEPTPRSQCQLASSCLQGMGGGGGREERRAGRGEAYVSGWGKDLCLGMSPVAGGEAPSFGQPQNVPCRAWALPHPGSSTGRRTSFPMWKSAFPAPRPRPLASLCREGKSPCPLPGSLALGPSWAVSPLLAGRVSGDLWWLRWGAIRKIP